MQKGIGGVGKSRKKLIFGDVNLCCESRGLVIVFPLHGESIVWPSHVVMTLAEVMK